jgi:hypothetical protein
VLCDVEVLLAAPVVVRHLVAVWHAAVVLAEKEVDLTVPMCGAVGGGFGRVAATGQSLVVVIDRCVG